jgi:tartrate-resistant acid phosphatase type 5
MINCSEDSITFYAIGDFGEVSPMVQAVSTAMNSLSLSECPPCFVIALGDNFYPHGADSVDDPCFDVLWKETFLCHKNLRIPWKVSLGNHDYLGNIQAQIDYTTDPKNTDGLWQCPSNNYHFSVSLGSENIMDAFCLDTNGYCAYIQ